MPARREIQREWPAIAVLWPHPLAQRGASTKKARGLLSVGFGLERRFVPASELFDPQRRSDEYCLQDDGSPDVELRHFFQADALKSVKACFSLPSTSAFNSGLATSALRRSVWLASTYCRKLVWNSPTRFTGTSSR
jgi:hypothetical protein